MADSRQDAKDSFHFFQRGAVPTWPPDAGTKTEAQKQKPRPNRGRGFYDSISNRLSAFSFGCLERIDFCFGFIGFNGYVSGQITIAVFPLNGGIRTGTAVPATGKLGTPFAAIALVDDLVTDATVVGAALGRHKGALRTFFNCCAIHWNHPLPALSH